MLLTCLWVVGCIGVLCGFKAGHMIGSNREMPPDEAAVYDAGFKAGYDQCDYDRMVCEVAALHPQTKVTSG